MRRAATCGCGGRGGHGNVKPDKTGAGIGGGTTTGAAGNDGRGWNRDGEVGHEGARQHGNKTAVGRPYVPLQQAAKGLSVE